VGVRLKVNENLPNGVAEFLNGHGYDALTTPDQGLQGIPDDELWVAYRAKAAGWLPPTRGLPICGVIRREAMPG
jgi:hypothetical protein